MRGVGLFLLLCAAAGAAIVPSLSLEELVDQSEIIVHGRVGRSWTEWDQAHKYIWTHHEIEVIDPIRGVLGRPIVVSEPGGRLDGVTMRFSGALQYVTGEEAIVFLYRTPIGYLRATGFGQGKYTVQSGMRVHADLRGLDLVRRGAPYLAPEGLPLTEFKMRVRAALRGK